MFEHYLIVGSLILWTICITVLAAYLIEFVRFVKENKRKERDTQGLDETVNKILQYKKMNPRQSIIDDVKRYQELRDSDYYKSDAYFEELCGRQLIHMDDVKMWHKVNKKNENEIN